ncbi:cyclic lactone autoinducer peptide [Clostridium thermosuccinogenes]|nr:cyclic lactone autoinducer peptide [Pseudoclostridium thermosuccinogenes]
MMKKFLAIVSAILSLIAITAVSTASFYWVYQPKAPKSLTK